jgi:hypothetical protein
MYRHCIKYLCLAQLEGVLANFNRQVDWPALKTNIVFYTSVIVILSVSSSFKKFYLLRSRNYFQSACAVLAGPKNKIFLVVLVIYFLFSRHSERNLESNYLPALEWWHWCMLCWNRSGKLKFYHAAKILPCSYHLLVW